MASKTLTGKAQALSGLPVGTFQITTKTANPTQQVVPFTAWLSSSASLGKESTTQLFPFTTAVMHISTGFRSQTN